MKLIIENTADGSPTLYREDIDEHYHSVKGAETESTHVYINNGWQPAAEAATSPVRVFEVGFGSGLNAALTALAARHKDVPTIYYSSELYPLPKDTVRTIASCYPENLRSVLETVNDSPWGGAVEINPRFTLIKLPADLLTMHVPDKIDVVYFDAFAPEKQPEMWTEEIFVKIYAAMNPGARLTTYCAKGAIRRMLTRVGFTCERLPGPPAGKREILRATKSLPMD